jgi:serine/threonine protein kinase
MICPKCNCEIRDGAKFCEHCGSSLSSISSISKGYSSANYEEFNVDEEDLMETIIEKNVESAQKTQSISQGKSVGDRYEVLKVLGRGGFAEVFKGRDKNLDREVAIKRLLTKQLDAASSEEILMRFKNEAMAIARLKHRNIVEVYDYDFDEQGYYIVMEYIEGGSLSDYVRKQTKLPPNEAIQFAKGISQGLYYAHQRKLVHRDIKLYTKAVSLFPRLWISGLRGRARNLNSPLPVMPWAHQDIWRRNRGETQKM